MGNSQPVGVFDSGIGGFTVLQELQRILPGENTVYLGDAARMPYGERDNEEIIAFTAAAIRFLEARGVKAILLACNTASSLMDRLTSQVPLFSIVEAGCVAATEHQPQGRIGLICTTATARNRAYEKTLASLTKKLGFITQGAPDLARVINDNREELILLKQNIHGAIDPILTQGEVEALLLGCTHYPIVRETIELLYPRLSLINPAEKQVASLVEYLSAEGAFNDDEKRRGQTDIYATGSWSDYRTFRNITRQLKINYQHLELAALDIDDEQKTCVHR